MLTKEEKKARNSIFWNDFKKEMRPVKSSSGRSISWTSYPSDVKGIFIRMEIDNHGARLCVDLQPKDDGIRSIFWEQMTELKVVLENATGEAEWVEDFEVVSGRKVSRIYWENKSVNFFEGNDDPAIKMYLKEKLIAFDKFYQEYKEILITLAE